MPADDAVRAFDRGLAAASMAERRDATGLAAFDAAGARPAISPVHRGVPGGPRPLTTALPAPGAGPRPFDAASGLGQVGALQRELAKQRRGLGVRGLLAAVRRADHRGHAVRAGQPGLGGPVLPGRGRACSTWWCSTRRPRSGSPTRSARWAGRGRRSSSATASRCRRRRSPSRSSGRRRRRRRGPRRDRRWRTRSRILTECVQARVPRQWLSWHYRSQDESLIAFSNRPVLREPAVVVPGADARAGRRRPDGRGVSLVRVRRHVPPLRRRASCCAPTRSRREAIVAEIRRRFDRRRPDDAARRSASSRSTPSSGPNRGAAARRRRRAAGRARWTAADGEGLFVKNLENVQGDERDVVLFSTGSRANEPRRRCR